MKFIQTIIRRLDTAQRRHYPLAFGYAVVKKYGEDEAGRQAALFTYYAFLSLFPLLLIITTLTDVIAGSYPHLQTAIIKGVTNYFPVLGNQLSAHVHSLHKSGLALMIGILFTLYGARGVAEAFRYGVQHIWHIPIRQRDGFPRSAFKSISIIIIGGFGFMLASIIAGWAAAAGHGLFPRLLSLAINLFILFWLFRYLLNACLPKHLPGRDTRAAALLAAVGLVTLQGLGGYLLTRELKHLDALYSYFALSLGLLFWIYLQAQMLFYAAEIASVRAQRYWPRSLSGHDLTAADERAKARLTTED